MSDEVFPACGSSNSRKIATTGWQIFISRTGCSCFSIIHHAWLFFNFPDDMDGWSCWKRRAHPPPWHCPSEVEDSTRNFRSYRMYGKQVLKYNMYALTVDLASYSTKPNHWSSTDFRDAYLVKTRARAHNCTLFPFGTLFPHTQA